MIVNEKGVIAIDQKFVERCFEWADFAKRHCLAVTCNVRSKLVFRPMVYGYSNARCRAMKTELLTKRQAEELLSMETVSDIADFLLRSQIYKQDFSRLPPHMDDEERVEVALARNFSRVAQKLFKITPLQSKETIKAFLGRYDVLNMKTILLSKKLGKKADEIRHLLIPAGSLSAEDLENLLSAADSDALYSAIRHTEFGKRFLSSLSIRRIPKSKIKALFQDPSGNGARLELLLTSLDLFYFEVASQVLSISGEKDANIVLGILGSEIDAKNIVTIMRLKRSEFAANEISKNLIGGGTFTKSQMGKMVLAKDVDEIAKIAIKFFTSDVGTRAFEDAHRLFKGDGRLSHFEVVFKNSIARHSLKGLHRSMLSIGVIAGFLFLKEEEMNNIRKIVRGKILGLPAKDIEEMLVLIG